MADVTLKMKKIDPSVGAGGLQLPRTVGAAKLTAKAEADVHCDHQRASMSPREGPIVFVVCMCNCFGVCLDAQTCVCVCVCALCELT